MCSAYLPPTYCHCDTTDTTGLNVIASHMIRYRVATNASGKILDRTGNSSDVELFGWATPECNVPRDAPVAAEHLDADRWLVSLASLANKAFHAPSREQDQVLRMFFHLIQLAPVDFENILVAGLNERELEALLRVQAFESAVFRLLEKSFGAMVSFPPGGAGQMATVWLPDAGDEQSGSAAATSLALIGCACQAILASVSAVDLKRPSSGIN